MKWIARCTASWAMVKPEKDKSRKRWTSSSITTSPTSSQSSTATGTDKPMQPAVSNHLNAWWQNCKRLASRSWTSMDMTPWPLWKRSTHSKLDPNSRWPSWPGPSKVGALPVCKGKAGTAKSPPEPSSNRFAKNWG